MINEVKLNLILKAIDDKKGENIQTFDVDEYSPFFTNIVICTMINKRAGRAIADEIDKVCAQINEPIKNIEGDNTSEWVLVDCGDIIVHVFTEKERERINLDQLISKYHN